MNKVYSYLNFFLFSLWLWTDLQTFFSKVILMFSSNDRYGLIMRSYNKAIVEKK